MQTVVSTPSVYSHLGTEFLLTFFIRFGPLPQHPIEAYKHKYWEYP